MYEYEKTLLYLYPVADKLSGIYRKRAHGAIRDSFYRHDGAEVQILETIGLFNVEGAIKIAKIDVGEALLKLTEIERALLEIQYIRRKNVISALPFKRFPFSERSFYRRIFSAIKRFSYLLKLNGNDERWFLETFSSCPEVMRVYGNVRRGRDLYYRRAIDGFTFTVAGEGRILKNAKC